MNAPPPGNPPWQEHVKRLQRLYGTISAETKQATTGQTLSGDGGADEARRGEWTATPPGRLGRRLLADIKLSPSSRSRAG
jgi:hypothetical protein